MNEYPESGFDNHFMSAEKEPSHHVAHKLIPKFEEIEEDREQSDSSDSQEQPQIPNKHEESSPREAQGPLVLSTIMEEDLSPSRENTTLTIEEDLFHGQAIRNISTVIEEEESAS